MSMSLALGRPPRFSAVNVCDTRRDKTANRTTITLQFTGKDQQLNPLPRCGNTCHLILEEQPVAEETPITSPLDSRQQMQLKLEYTNAQTSDGKHMAVWANLTESLGAVQGKRIMDRLTSGASLADWFGALREFSNLRSFSGAQTLAPSLFPNIVFSPSAKPEHLARVVGKWLQSQYLPIDLTHSASFND